MNVADVLVLLAELATLAWFAVFVALVASAFRAGRRLPRPRLDAWGRAVTTHARLALVGGTLLLFVLTLLQLAGPRMGLDVPRIF